MKSRSQQASPNNTTVKVNLVALLSINSQVSCNKRLSAYRVHHRFVSNYFKSNNLFCLIIDITSSLYLKLLQLILLVKLSKLSNAMTGSILVIWILLTKAIYLTLKKHKYCKTDKLIYSAAKVLLMTNQSKLHQLKITAILKFMIQRLP